MASRLFDKWQGQFLDWIVTECWEILEDTDFPTVKRWRDAGGKVLGHFQVYFLEEIAHGRNIDIENMWRACTAGTRIPISATICTQPLKPRLNFCKIRPG